MSEIVEVKVGGSYGGTHTLALVGNPLVPGATTGSDAGTFPAVLGLLPQPLPAGRLLEFKSYNHVTGASEPSPTHQFHAMVLRPTGVAGQWYVVFKSALFTVPATPADAILTHAIPEPVDVLSGDRVAFYGAGIPFAQQGGGTDHELIYPCSGVPPQGALITPIAVGDPDYPIYDSVSRQYSFAATVDTRISAVGNPLIGRYFACDLADVLGLLQTPLPAGTLRGFRTFNQVNTGAQGPSSGHTFHAYVLRPDATPVVVGNPLVALTLGSRSSVHGSLVNILSILPEPLPAGLLTSFKTFSQSAGCGAYTSPGGQFVPYVLRPLGSNQYLIVYKGDLTTTPATPTDSVIDYPVTPFAVQAGDVLGFYGDSAAFDAAGSDRLAYPCGALPAQGTTITFGDATYPDVGYTPVVSFAAIVTPSQRYRVVFGSAEFTVPTTPADAVVCFPVAPTPVRAGDLIAFYGKGIPIDTSGPDHEANWASPAAPVQGATIVVGPGTPDYYPAAHPATYSFAAEVEAPDYTDEVSAVTWSRSLTALGEAEFKVDDPTGLFLPADDAVVEICQNLVLVWAGQVTGISVEPRGYGEGTIVTVQASDWNALPSRAMFVQRAFSGYLGAILIDICGATHELGELGIVLDTAISSTFGPQLVAFTADQWDGEALLSYLQQQAGYIFWIDPYKTLRAWSVGDRSSGVTLSPANGNFTGGSWKRMRYDYRNRQWVVWGGNLGSDLQWFQGHSYPTPFVCAAGQTIFPLDCKPALPPQGFIVNFGLGYWDSGVWHPGGPSGYVYIPFGGLGAPAYYDAANNQVIFTPGTYAALQAGDLVQIAVQVRFPQAVLVIDQTEIDAHGPYTKSEARPDLLTLAEAKAWGSARLRTTSGRPKVPRMSTRVPRLGVGETIAVNFAQVGLNETCFIQAVKATLETVEEDGYCEPFYDLTLASGEEIAANPDSVWRQVAGGGGTSAGSSAGGGGGSQSVSGYPPGVIFVFAGVVAPAGFFGLPHTTPISRTAYPSLFAVAQACWALLGNGVLYGVGDGSTTFTLPNPGDRALFAAGTSIAVGQQFGAATHAHHGGAVTIAPHTSPLGHGTTPVGVNVESANVGLQVTRDTMNSGLDGRSVDIVSDVSESGHVHEASFDPADLPAHEVSAHNVTNVADTDEASSLGPGMGFMAIIAY